VTTRRLDCYKPIHHPVASQPITNVHFNVSPFSLLFFLFGVLRGLKKHSTLLCFPAFCLARIQKTAIFRFCFTLTCPSTSHTKHAHRHAVLDCTAPSVPNGARGGLPLLWQWCCAGVWPKILVAPAPMQTERNVVRQSNGCHRTCNAPHRDPINGCQTGTQCPILLQTSFSPAATRCASTMHSSDFSASPLYTRSSSQPSSSATAASRGTNIASCV
jgi:hypothetical protein